MAAPPDAVILPTLDERGIPVHRLELPRAPGPADVRTARRLRRIDADGRFDVVHAHSSKAGGLVRAVLPRPSRLFYTPNCFAFAAAFGSTERRLYRLAEQALVPRTGTLIAASEWERELGERELRGSAKRMAMVHNGVVDPGSPAPDPELIAFKGDGRLAGAVLVLRPQKDPLTLVRAVALLKRRGRLSFRVAVVGNGELGDAVSAEIEALGLGEDMRRFPFAGAPGPYLAALDLFVLPSLWESFPLAVLEALASATPVLATRVGGTPEAVREGTTGRLVDPGDPEGLADAMGRMMEDPEGLASMAAGGRAAYEERFTVDRMVDAVAALYDRALR